MHPRKLKPKRQVVPDAMRARLEELRKERRAAGARLHAKDVLEDASDPASPLHSYFEWNDGLAAQRWRLRQAHELLAAVDFVDTLAANRRRRSLPALIAGTRRREYVVPTMGKGYVIRDEALDHAGARHDLAQRLLVKLFAWEREASDVLELQRLVTLVRAERARAQKALEQKAVPRKKAA
jgi:hypothetical protein